MLLFRLALLSSSVVSAATVQLPQSIVPDRPSSPLPSLLSRGFQWTANVSLLSSLWSNVSEQWDQTIVSAPNATQIQLLLTSSNCASGLWNETFIPGLHVSAGAHAMPPPPRPVRYTCNAELFGTDLNPASCLQAWTLIPPLERELSFGPRFIGRVATDYDVRLPRRYLSCTCADRPRTYCCLRC